MKKVSFILLFLSTLGFSQTPLIDSPGKTIGSDFNGDGIHDFIVGARGNDDGAAANAGAVYIFFGSTTLSGTQDIGGVESADLTVLGKGGGDYVGESVASVGDLNGDGIDDFAMGGPFNNEGGTDDEGAVYIFFGSTTLSGTKNLGGGQSADVTVLGKAVNNYLGYRVTTAGDVNGDGFDDVIIGADRNGDSAFRAGAAYVFFGSDDLGGTKSLGGVQSADVTILGKVASDYLGLGVSSTGDVNGDGFDDIIIGARRNDDQANRAGAAYIFFGASDLSGTKNLASVESADMTILGKIDYDELGISVSGAGDLNGDGFDDLVAGAFNNDDGGGNNEGAAYVFFGSTTLSGTQNLGGGQSADFTILGKNTTDFLGRVANAGDVNDDGFDDLMVGAAFNNEGGAGDEGAAYIFFGSRSLDGTKTLGGVDSADVTFLGKGTEDRLSYGLSGIGDVNGDGIPDMFFGAPNNNDGGTDDEGAAYVFFGSTTLSGTKDTGTSDEDIRILGKATNNFLGRSVGGGRGNPGP